MDLFFDIPQDIWRLLLREFDVYEFSRSAKLDILSVALVDPL